MHLDFPLDFLVISAYSLLSGKVSLCENKDLIAIQSLMSEAMCSYSMATFILYLLIYLALLISNI